MLNESIDSLATGDYLVTRTLLGAFTDGVYASGSTSTLTINAVVESATGLQRVTGGFEMRADEQGIRANDIRVIYTRTQLHTRDSVYENDHITIDGALFTVFRCEPWDLTGEIHYRALASRVTHGAG